MCVFAGVHLVRAQRTATFVILYTVIVQSLTSAAYCVNTVMLHDSIWMQQNYAQQLDDNSDDDENDFEGYVDHAVGEDNSRYV
jgi:hypothetical protein